MASNDFEKAAARHLPDTSCQGQACCSSPSAMCYWFMVSLAAWGLLSLVGMYWHPLHAFSEVTILFAASIGCFANRIKNHTIHCAITAWVFLGGAVVFLLPNIGLIEIDPRYVWPVLATGTFLAFILEWQYTSRPTR